MDNDQNTKNLDINLFDDISSSSTIPISTSKVQKTLELKIDWFVRVLDGIEKLSDKTSELENKIYNNRSYLTSNIASTREYIYSELKNLRSDFTKCKESQHCLMDYSKHNLNEKIDKVTNKIETETRRMEDKVLIDISKTIEKVSVRVDKINDAMVSVRVKIATIGTIGGLVGSICLFITQFIFKKYFQ